MDKVNAGKLYQEVIGALYHPKNIRLVEDRYGCTISELIDRIQAVSNIDMVSVPISYELTPGYEAAATGGYSRMVEELRYMVNQKDHDIQTLKEQMEMLKRTTPRDAPSQIVHLDADTVQVTVGLGPKHHALSVAVNGVTKLVIYRSRDVTITHTGR